MGIVVPIDHGSALAKSVMSVFETHKKAKQLNRRRWNFTMVAWCSRSKL